MALAAAIVTLSTAAGVLNPYVSKVIDYVNPPPPPPAQHSRTGNLGLEFWQDNTQLNLVELAEPANDESAVRPWRVDLNPSAFEMRVPLSDGDEINMVKINMVNLGQRLHLQHQGEKWLFTIDGVVGV